MLAWLAPSDLLRRLYQGLVPPRGPACSLLIHGDLFMPSYQSTDGTRLRCRSSGSLLYSAGTAGAGRGGGGFLLPQRDVERSYRQTMAAGTQNVPSLRCVADGDRRPWHTSGTPCDRATPATASLCHTSPSLETRLRDASGPEACLRDKPQPGDIPREMRIA